MNNNINKAFFTEEELNLINGIKIIKDENINNKIIDEGDEEEKLKLKKEKLKISQKKYFEKNKEKIYAYNRTYFKDKYNNDKEYRESVLRSSCKSHKRRTDEDPEFKLKKNEYCKNYMREKKQESPEFVKLCNKRCLEVYHRKKMLLNETNNNIIVNC
jgi:hypothetical protein